MVLVLFLFVLDTSYGNVIYEIQKETYQVFICFPRIAYDGLSRPQNGAIL